MMSQREFTDRVDIFVDRLDSQWAIFYIVTSGIAKVPYIPIVQHNSLAVDEMLICSKVGTLDKRRLESKSVVPSSNPIYLKERISLYSFQPLFRRVGDEHRGPVAAGLYLIATV